MNHPSFSWLSAIRNIIIWYLAFGIGAWSFLDFFATGDKISFWAVIGCSAIVIGLTVTINEWLFD
jgi:drug/metabolite transporter (DMT)-like permease|tara:strand:+ start:261 stop:455 length:195 start_codon:yes stop_codon:yes gene_type:complete